MTMSARWGLSPRVRGNHSLRMFNVIRRGSIPACAGEPARGIERQPSPRVYPRVCGGTPPALNIPCQVRGLSPRVRGNLYHRAVYPPRRRSIPACAGEPGGHPRSPRGAAVYPRVCGGTKKVHFLMGWPDGLSPRVRGNPTPTDLPPPARRSIPACAGEPSASGAIRCRCTVYPRVCGGTAGCPSKARPVDGLSPRVRGNRESTG